MKFHGMTLTAIAALTGCAMAPAPEVDNSANNSTIVIKSSSSFGGRLLPNISGNETIYLRDDRKRSMNDFKFDNWLLQHTAGYFTSGNEEIIRLDSKLQWQLLKKNKTYTECPLGGCIRTSNTAQPAQNSNNTTPQHDDTQCKLTVSRNEFKVVPSNEQRMFAQANTHLYRLNWLVEMKDATGKLATNTVTFDFWTTEPAGAVAQALKTQETFNKNYLSAVVNNLNNAGIQLNHDVYAALSGLGAKLGDKSENWSIGLGKELQKLKGYPLSIVVEWRATDHTCGNDSNTATASANNNDSASSPLDWLTKKAVGGLSSNNTPETDALMRYSYEVQSINVQPEHDSRFVVPNDYHLQK